ncbi:MAG: asparagine synthase (glutamine-hydrolyzing) [Bacteroidia bacterium]
MCGIAGIISKKPLHSTILLKMSEKMRHRGPDGEGFALLEDKHFVPYSGNETPIDCLNRELEFSPKKSLPAESREFKTAFIHRRLSIIDTHYTGHQPMCDAASKIWITYNGEIYNYLELREELENVGFKFRTKSDTEVIIAAYQHWGKDCLNHFNGMWAFAIADFSKNSLFISRDRFAVKPLYYFQNDEVFAFASEQKILLHSGLVKAEMNPEAIFDYFTFGEIEYQTTGFFKEIMELHGGFYIETSLSNPKAEAKQWYTLKTVADDAPSNFEMEKINHLISESVRLRMRADVEVGSCLSGGLDSSAIVAYMDKHLKGQPFHVFTATFPGQDVDEGKWAKIAAERTSAIRHEITPSQEGLLKDFQELTYAQDIPIWSTSTYAQFCVMKLVKSQGIRVVLDGQGGDEIFAGYHPHEYFLMKGMSFSERLKYMFSPSAEGLAGFYLKQFLRFDGAFRLSQPASKKLFTTYFKDLQLLNPDFRDSYSSRFARENHPSGEDLNSRLSLEMQNSSLKAYLKCEDRCSMWHSVESRTPFSDDHQLIEYLFSIPGREKIKKHQFKYLLREAAGTKIPESIKNRSDKQGYTTPNKQWIYESAPALNDLFTDDLSDILNVKSIKANYSQIFGKESNIAENRLFKFLSFAMWYRVFISEFK